MRTVFLSGCNWLTADQQRRSLRAAAVSAAAMVATFATALLIEHVAHLRVDIVILAVVLAVTLSRRQQVHTGWARAVTLVTLPVIAVAAAEVGRLMAHHPNVGDTLFVVCVSAGIWLRRFGTAFTRVGTLLTLPFIALLVTPVPVALRSAAESEGHAQELWAALISLVAVSWVTAAQWVDRRLTPLVHREFVPPDITRQATRRQAKRLPASTRMAAQMAVALAAAFAVGRWLYPEHWSWLVITAYIVAAGNRGRGDVAYKSVLRFIGAGVGTVAATLVAGAYPPGDKTPIVIIFVVLAVAGWLRSINYAFWAAGMTSVLALLNGYFGQGGSELIDERLGGIAIGAVLAVASAWLVLPVKTTDVVRRRVADALAALTDYLTAARRGSPTLEDEQRRFDRTLDLVEQVSPAVRAHRRLPTLLRGDRPHQSDAIEALLAYREPIRALTGEVTAGRGVDRAFLKHLQERVIAARRSMAATKETPVLDACLKDGRRATFLA